MRLFMRGGFFFLVICFVFDSSFVFARGGPAKTCEEDIRQCEDNVAITSHNLSSSGTGPVTTIITSEICVFCHTPHMAADEGPLWNRQLRHTGYTMYSPMYDSSWQGSLDLQRSANPRGYSKLCLSCHDGSMAIGSIRNAPNSGVGTGINMIFRDSGLPIEGIPYGLTNEPAEQYTGDTRRLGTDLRNDHPISFLLDEGTQESLVSIDGELIVPPGSHALGSDPGVRLYPLDFSGPDNAVQCTSCHNPHTVYPKFLRESLYNSRALPGGSSFNFTATASPSNQICVSCHAMPIGGSKIGWSGSTHDIIIANSSAPIAAGFGDGATRTVREHGCLNCHDPHTVAGADRLHRNGANAANGMPSIENTCFQCHISPSDYIPTLETQSILRYVAAPDIRSEFAKGCLDGIRGGALNDGSSMPLDTNWSTNPFSDDCFNPGSTDGMHQPVFVSTRSIENRGDVHQNPPVDNVEEMVLNAPSDPSMVHVECTDCHNPHQVRKENRMRGMKGITINGDIIGGDSGLDAANDIEYAMPDATRMNVSNLVEPYKDERNYETGPNSTGRVEPLVYEICLRCHGDTFAWNMPYLAYGAERGNFGGSVTLRHRGHIEGDYPDESWEARYPSNLNAYKFGASNKRLEFNPSTSAKTRPNILSSPSMEVENRITFLPYNPSYHPVAAPGRNGTLALCLQLEAAFSLDCSTQQQAAYSLSNLTIQCTDCHSNDAFGYTGNNAANAQVVAGPVTGLASGSYKRTSDKDSNLAVVAGGDGNYLDNPDDPAQGPHGSLNKRILRANYDTKLGTDSLGCCAGAGYRGDNSFALCFLCHEKSVILDGDTTTGTNFGGMEGGDFPGYRAWDSNLHAYHLYNSHAACHECHNNLHSNVEANNTIYGRGEDLNGAICGGSAANCFLPPDGIDHDGIEDGYMNTHLINFGPQATGDQAYYPNWYFDGGQFRCNLRCHGVTMTACAYYTHTVGGTDPGPWSCGGGPQDF